MSDHALRVAAATGLDRPTAQRVLDALSPVADPKAAASAVDLARFFEVDPVIAARLIRAALSKERSDARG